MVKERGKKWNSHVRLSRLSPLPPSALPWLKPTDRWKATGRVTPLHSPQWMEYRPLWQERRLSSDRNSNPNLIQAAAPDLSLRQNGGIAVAYNPNLRVFGRSFPFSFEVLRKMGFHKGKDFRFQIPRLVVNDVERKRTRCPITLQGTLADLEHQADLLVIQQRFTIIIGRWGMSGVVRFKSSKRFIMRSIHSRKVSLSNSSILNPPAFEFEIVP